MATAREIMTPGVECVSVGETLVDAAGGCATSTSVRCRSAARTTGSRAC